MPTAVLIRASKPPRPVQAQAAEAPEPLQPGPAGPPTAEAETPAAVVTPPPGDQRGEQRRGRLFRQFRDVDVPSRYVPGVVTRPLTSEPAVASEAESPAWVPRSSSDASVAFLASAVALA